MLDFLEPESDEPSFDDGISSFDHEPMPFSDDELAEFAKRAIEYHRAHQPSQGRTIGFIAHWRELAAHRFLN